MTKQEQVIPRRNVTFYNVDADLWRRVKEFLDKYPRVPSVSALIRVSLDTYLELADKHGIDVDWKIKFPAYHDGTEPRKDSSHDAH